VKAVFFDAGGTLVHIDYPRVARVVQEVLGRDLSGADFIAAEYVGRAAIEAGMAKGDLPTDTSRWAVHFRAMLASIGLSDAEFDRVGPFIIAEHKQRHLWSAVFPGTAEGLAALRRAGFLVAVISNADGTVEELLRGVGLCDSLAFVIDSGRVGVEKPDRRIFEIALERTTGQGGEEGHGRLREATGGEGISASDCYYVGDIYPIDVVGARNAGMTPVLLDPLGRYGDLGCRTTRNVAEFCRELVSAHAAA
jgi:FMN phosphatase YigB (HAD superfamily)